MDIKEKIALVTGGANGLGFAYATELLRNGVGHVAILDLANSNGEESAKKLNDQFGPGKAIFVICDVSKPQELEAGFAKTVSEFGGLDIVINNAGIMDDSRWELMVNVNINGVIRGTLLGLQLMGKDKGGNGGTIVNISSILGVIPLSTFPIYVGTKHAIIGFSRSIAQPYHYKRTGVRILTVCPDAAETQLLTKCIERKLDIVDAEEITDNLKSYPTLTTDVAAKRMVDIIRIAENGSVWAMMATEPIYELDVPNAPGKKIVANGNQCNKLHHGLY